MFTFGLSFQTLVMRLIFLLLFVFCSFCGWAQDDILSNLTRKKAGEGTVTIHQDSRLNALLQRTPYANSDEEQSNTVKIAGFRVQVYAGNNSRQARSEAYSIAEKVRAAFPELAVYTHFINPRWICQVGDFRSIEEADMVMRKLKTTGEFKEVSIVRAQINITY